MGTTVMTIHLSAVRQELVRSLVERGRFASEDEAIDAALQLLAQREESEQARVLDGIRQGLADRDAGRGRPAEEVFADIRHHLD